MTKTIWEAELRRFISFNDEERWRWLTKLLFTLTMLARGTYTTGGDGLDDPQKMRRFNELIHRTASQLLQTATGRPGMPDAVFAKLLDEEIAVLGIEGDGLTKLIRMRDQCDTP